MYNPLLRYLLSNHFLATVLIIAAAFFLYEIRSILVVLFISYIVMAGLEPYVKWLMHKGLNKSISVVIVYVLSLATIMLLVLPLLPFFAAQIQSLFENIPRYVREATSILGFNITTAQINQAISPNLSELGKNAVSLTGKIFGGAFLVLTTFVISLYMLLYHDRVANFTKYFVPRRLEKQAMDTEILIKEKLGAWLRGQIFLSLVIGVITYLALIAIGMATGSQDLINVALPLALIAGLLEIVPTVGPIISAIPAIVVAFSSSPVTAVAVALTYIVIQLLENNLLVPKIMQKAVGLNPVIVIVAILIGAQLMAVVGALLAIPFLSVLLILYKSIRSLKQ